MGAEPRDNVGCLMSLWLTCGLLLLLGGLSMMHLSRAVGVFLCVPGLAILGIAVQYWRGQGKA